MSNRWTLAHTVAVAATLSVPPSVVTYLLGCDSAMPAILTAMACGAVVGAVVYQHSISDEE